jgi:hypothetical protein
MFLERQFLVAKGDDWSVAAREGKEIMGSAKKTEEREKRMGEKNPEETKRERRMKRRSLRAVTTGRHSRGRRKLFAHHHRESVSSLHLDIE